MNNSLLTEIRTRINRTNGTELNEIVQMINARRDGLTLQARSSLWVGKSVSFDNDGYRFFGRVVKVNRKNTKVSAIREDKLENGTRPSVWTVPNTMLDHAPTFNTEQMKHTSVPVG
jgi:hypothetical protein